jgi:hypothetical protein
MVQMLAGFQLSQGLYTVAKLGIPDRLVEGPRSADDVAAAVGADVGAPSSGSCASWPASASSPRWTPASSP